MQKLLLATLCITIGTEETGCAVPVGTAEIEVSAWSGVDLHVSVQSD